VVIASFLWEGLVALGTLVLAAFTGWLAWVTRRLARTTALEVQAQWRPIIVPAKPIVDLVGPDETRALNYELTVRLKNIGAGPALAVRVDRFESGDTYVEGAKFPRIVVVAPQEEVDATIKYALYGKTSADYAQATGGYGPVGLPTQITVKYEDMAGRPLSTDMELKIFKWLDADEPYISAVAIGDGQRRSFEYPRGDLDALARSRQSYRIPRYSWAGARRELFPPPDTEPRPLAERIRRAWATLLGKPTDRRLWYVPLPARQTMSQRVQWGVLAFKQTLDKPTPSYLLVGLGRPYKFARGMRYAFRAYWRIT
jgi:hypothetical protein